MAQLGKRGRRLLAAASASIAVVAIAGLAFGPGGFAIAFAVGLIATAWWGDDDLGTCLPIAILFLLILVLIGFLIAFMTFVYLR